MKKFSLLFFSVIIFVSIFSPGVFASQEITLFLNNVKVELSTPPVLKNNRTMITLDSGFFKKAGVLARYDKETEIITMDGKYSSVEFTVGEKKALIHRKYDFTGIPETIEMDVEPFADEGKVYIPLRFAAEGLGALVEWDGANNSVLVAFEKETDIIPVERPLGYEEINISELSEDDELYLWVQENKNNTGIYHKMLDSKNYVLICAGEKPTGGYSIEINSVTQVYPGRIYIGAEVFAPSPDMMVPQVITYPCMLIVLDIDGEISVDGIINGSSYNAAEEIQFETVSPETIAADEELSAWVDELHRQAGIHLKQKDGYIYALVAAGEKNTGGYSVSVDKVTKEQSGEIFIHAVVNSPDPDMMVIQVITWPYIVVRFEGTDLENVHGEIENSSPIKDIVDFK